MTDPVHVYCDGSRLAPPHPNARGRPQNGTPGGYGLRAVARLKHGLGQVLWEDGGRLPRLQSAYHAEAHAIAAALDLASRRLPDIPHITVVSDALSLIERLDRLQTDPDRADDQLFSLPFLLRAYRASDHLPVAFRWTRGHNGNPDHDRADHIARGFARGLSAKDLCLFQPASRPRPQTTK